MSRLRSDSGFALIEVVVSAAVLAMISLAILAGIDGAAASSGREKARTAAASLAEADQERLRALSVTTLAQYANSAPYVVPDPAGQTKTVDGVAYKVTSTAQWVGDDTSGSVSCTTDSHAAQYFHITSTVTSAVVGKQIPPVTIDSIAAPNVAYSSTNGTLVVQVYNALGAPVAGKLVSISGGTPPPAASTNSAGCAVFQQIPTQAGGVTYTATIGGCVDHFGNDPSSATGTVNPGRVTLITMRCDTGTTVTANVKTYPPGSTAPPPTVDSKAFQVSVVNSGETGMLRPFPPVAGASELATTNATALFPFPQKYTFFTGSCHYNDPTDSQYGSVNTSGANGTLLAGQQILATTASVNVFQPPLNVQITRNSSGTQATTSMTVYAVPVAPSTDQCAQKKITLQTFDTDSSSAYKWMVGRSYTGNVLDAGVPYGRYKLCFQDGNRYWSPTTYANTQSGSDPSSYDNTTPPTGQPNTMTFAPASGWSRTSCAS